MAWSLPSVFFLVFFTEETCGYRCETSFVKTLRVSLPIMRPTNVVCVIALASPSKRRTAVLTAASNAFISCDPFEVLMVERIVYGFERRKSIECCLRSAGVKMELSTLSATIETWDWLAFNSWSRYPSSDTNSNPFVENSVHLSFNMVTAPSYDAAITKMVFQIVGPAFRTGTTNT